MRAAGLFVLLIFFIGCAGPKLYRGAGPHNLFIDSAKPGAVLHVHEVDPGCGARYVGSVNLEHHWSALGLPTQPRTSYLVFSFDDGRVGTLLDAKPEHRYDVAVTVQDGVYGLRVLETGARGEQRPLARRELARCGAAL